MQFRFSAMIVAIAVLGMVLWLAVPRVVSVFDGHFQLVISWPDKEIPSTTFSLAYCWNEIEAARVQEYGATTNEVIFRPLEIDPTGQAFVMLPFSGKQSGSETSRHEPKFVVIQYNDNETIRRKTFSIPVGKGSRTLSVDRD